MARGRELSQLGSLITVDDSTKNIGVATATPSQKIGIGTLSPVSKVEVVGGVLVSGVVTATSFVGDGSGLSGITGGSFSNLVQDTSPELGGDLDINENDITGTGNINVAGVITATSFSGDGSSLTNISVSSAILSVAARSGGINVSVAAGIVTVFGRSSDTEVSVTF
jgi:hypothetical protein